MMAVITLSACQADEAPLTPAAETAYEKPEDEPQDIVDPVFVPYIGIETWPRNARLEAALDKTIAPTSFSKRYEETPLEVVGVAANITARTHAGLTALHRARSGDELSYYEPIRSIVTDDLWDQIVEYVELAESGDSSAIGSFAPQTSRDGLWAKVDGVRYISTGSLEVRFWGIPRFSMSDDDPTITFPVDVTAHANPNNIGYSAEFTATLTQNKGRWLLDGWSTVRTSEVTVLNETGRTGE